MASYLRKSGLAALLLAACSQNGTMKVGDTDIPTDSDVPIVTEDTDLAITSDPTEDTGTYDICNPKNWLYAPNGNTRPDCLGIMDNAINETFVHEHLGDLAGKTTTFYTGNGCIEDNLRYQADLVSSTGNVNGLNIAGTNSTVCGTEEEGLYGIALLDVSQGTEDRTGTSAVYEVRLFPEGVDFMSEEPLELKLDCTDSDYKNCTVQVYRN